MKSFFIAILFTCAAWAAQADTCDICGQEITGRFYFFTDAVTGERVMVCSTCALLPRCFICGLPVKDGTQLPDGRWLCARDARTAVMDADDAQQIFDGVHDDLDKLFARFTFFPTNVDVSMVDRVDMDSMFQLVGNTFESPNVLGFTVGTRVNGQKRYKIGLLSGQPEAQLEEVCAHELSHAWVGENVPPERHARLARDAEEGFCEMMGYLLADSKGEEGEKRRVLANSYTRGQVQLFIAAEQEYGFDQILDWMQYGVTGRLEDGHLDEVRDVNMPVSAPVVPHFTFQNAGARPLAPSMLQLQGIMWSDAPSAIINGQSFFTWDEHKVPVGQTTVTIRCVSITKSAVQVEDVDSGKELDLELPSN